MSVFRPLSGARPGRAGLRGVLSGWPCKCCSSACASSSCCSPSCSWSVIGTSCAITGTAGRARSTSRAGRSRWTRNTGARCVRASCRTGRANVRCATWRLVRRKKGEAVPLPDGVLARMQFSPYRVQLAGIRTAAVEYRPLRREVVLVGPAEKTDSASVPVRADVFETDLPFLREGQPIEAANDCAARSSPLPGQNRQGGDESRASGDHRPGA